MPRKSAARPRQARFLSPLELAEQLNSVVHQDDLKRKLVSAFSQFTLYLQDESVGKPLVLVYGPSGSGKTLSVELLARSLEIPLTIVSAAAISPPGYRGTTMKDVLMSHVEDRRRLNMQCGVVVIDEVDKWTTGALKAGQHTEAAAAGVHCQAEMLRYIEREVVKFIDESKDFEDFEDTELDTGQIMWVLAGAFTGIESVIRERCNPHWTIDDCLPHAIPEDFVKYGMLNELAARISTWAWTFPLKRTHLFDVLRQQQARLWVKRFEAIGCQLVIEDGAMAACAEHAFELKTGVRGAIAMMRRSMDDLFYEASMHRVTSLRVTPAMVKTGRIDAFPTL